ncbi:D-alanyl-D-alanine carboxypeptidase DacB precursor [compost metagenome]
MVAVTINDGDDWNDHAKLLNYGFENFPLTKLIGEGQRVQNGLVTRREFIYALSKGELEKIERRLVLKKSSRVEDFGLRGRITISLDGKEIGSVPVYERKVTESLAPEQQRSWSDSIGFTIKTLFMAD